MEKPETATEILAEINSDSPSGENSTAEPGEGNGTEGEEKPAVSQGQVPHPEPEKNEEEQEPSEAPVDHKKPHIDEDGKGQNDQWGFDEVQRRL